MRTKGKNIHMNNTEIEYVDLSWNPVTGCLRGCPYCYARRLANGRVRRHYLDNSNVIAGDPSEPFSPRFWRERLDGPSKYKASKAIFVCDMGDLFGQGVPWVTIAEVIDEAVECPQHDFLFLTKSPGNMVRFTFPPNAWVGATVTNESQLLSAAAWLDRIPAHHRFVSFEPLLGYLPTSWLRALAHSVEWFIIGAQTKPEIQPELPWLLDIHAVAAAYGIPIFHKDNLRVPERRLEWPVGYRKSVRDATEI